MKIAVPYDRGRINEHFGHCQYIEIHTAEEGKIIGKMVLPVSGSGHVFMCSLMKRLGVNVVLAGRMGKPAMVGLKDLGIDTYIGLSGSTENAVCAYLDGDLKSFSINNIDLSQMEDDCSCHH